LGGAAQLAFDITDGDGIADNNGVTVTAFSTDGVLGAAVTDGGVTGTLPGTVTLRDTQFFNELLQSITLASSIGFTLTLTENSTSGSTPDQFSFFLLDPVTSAPLFDTSDPDTGANALFVVDLGVAGGVQVYQPVSSPAATWTVTDITIAEPAVWLLFGSGLLGLAGGRRRR
jgi:hypothetical protein